MIKEMLYFLIILLTIPIGIFLTWLAKDEIKSWKKRFYLISIISLAISLVLLFLEFSLKTPFIFGLIFMVVLLSFLIIKAKD